MIHSYIMASARERSLKKGYCMRWPGLFRATKEQINRLGKLEKDITKTIITKRTIFIIQKISPAGRLQSCAQ
mgnify:FL=1